MTERQRWITAYQDACDTTEREAVARVIGSVSQEGSQSLSERAAEAMGAWAGRGPTEAPSLSSDAFVKGELAALADAQGGR